MVGFDSPLHTVLGGTSARKLETGLGLRTVGDLLRHYPRRYVQRGELTRLSDLREGEYVTIFAEVVSAHTRKIRQRLTKTDVVVTDGHGTLSLTFFNQPWREKQLHPGSRAFFAGQVESFNRRRQLTHPEYELLDAAGAVAAVAAGAAGAAGATAAGGPDDVSAGFAGALVAVYPAAAKVNTFAVARCVRLALDVTDYPDDPLPEPLRRRYGLLGVREAFEALHRPASDDDVARATERFRWEEALVLQAVLARRRADTGAQAAVPRAPRPGGVLQAFDARLPFELTAGQRQVAAEIDADLARSHPMQRLLQGEVGSGKTVVALRAMLAVVDAGGQAALVAPTEVLAQQHHRSITSMLGPLAMRGQLGGAEQATEVALLTGSLSQQAKQAALADAASGAAGIVVGTHALLQERVAFADLGLVVIDEQHRFGVEQRDAMRGKAEMPPHTLVMTATPIPRTVAMTVYGDLDVSTLDELPAGRAKIETVVVPVRDKPAWLDRVWQRLREEVAGGHQAYVVCARIGEDTAEEEDATEEGEEGSGSAAESRVIGAVDLAPALAEGPLAGLRIGLLHGRLPPDEKDAVMRAFAAGDLDVLVATTVIEVGVDVSNATAMVIMDAERFGMSQLHQLRGRVGRGSAGGLCLLVTGAAVGSPGRQRLDTVAGTRDGFRLADADLEARHEGTLFGQLQHGRSDLRFLSLVHHRDLIERARREAMAIVEADPDLTADASNAGLRAAVDALLARRDAIFLDKT